MLLPLARMALDKVTHSGSDSCVYLTSRIRLMFGCFQVTLTYSHIMEVPLISGVMNSLVASSILWILTLAYTMFIN